MKKGFNKEDGPFVRALDKALSSFNVQRQAYYSGTFVGNHVHRSLKVMTMHIQENFTYRHNTLKQPVNIATLCSSLVEVAQEHCADLVPQTRQIASRFEKAFTLFHDCHVIYDSKAVTDKDILQLGKYSEQHTRV